ncbi:MAG TPA: hypothetical protein PK535_04655 [Synergistaceae bacterium]|jgi:hypothetical protein|nr:hypothetical protein [Synergistaceae bacterium]HQF91711.1 hypothetical protein [Synergistaceae bacterium]HQH78235.1 hypothetical protein [Synergistaceae bacterium]
MEGNILVFFNGPWDGDRPEETRRNETSVPRLYRLLSEDPRQRSCYLPRVGTGSLEGAAALYDFDPHDPPQRRGRAPQDPGFSL